MAGGEPSAAPEAPSEGGAILFMMARGTSIAEGRSVHIWSLPGADQAPQEVFACNDRPRCTERYQDKLVPGLYRFRVGFRRHDGGSPDAKPVFSHDVELELEAAAGRYYVVDAVYGGDSIEQCSARVITPESGQR